MIFFRSLIFKILFPLWFLICCCLFFWTLVFKFSDKKTVFASKFWACGVLKLLKIVCKIDFEVRGVENLPQTPFVLACKHQSVWETIFFLVYFNNPAYVLKKELLSIPMYGRFLKALKMIPIDRSAGSSSIKLMQTNVTDRLSKDRSVIIFPEGTRQDVNKKTDCQPGIAFLYMDEKINFPIIPAGLNSGCFWNKSFTKKSGTIVVEFLPKIEKGKKRKEFVNILNEVIENSSSNLIRESKK